MPPSRPCDAARMSASTRCDDDASRTSTRRTGNVPDRLYSRLRYIKQKRLFANCNRPVLVLLYRAATRTVHQSMLRVRHHHIMMKGASLQQGDPLIAAAHNTRDDGGGAAAAADDDDYTALHLLFYIQPTAYSINGRGLLRGAYIFIYMYVCIYILNHKCKTRRTVCISYLDIQ